MGKKEIKLSLFAYHMIFYLGNPKTKAKKKQPLELKKTHS